MPPLFASGVMLLATVIGCSKDPALPSSDTEVPGSVAESSPTTARPGQADAAADLTSASHGKAQHARGEVWIDANGQKWFGNVPMDVFFDEPYTVASDQTSLVANTDPIPDSVPIDPVPSAPLDSVPIAPVAGSGDEDSWDSLITIAALDEEVKSIRNFMNENLQSVGAFNSAMLMLPPKAGTLAAMAELATKHPESVSWKDDAAYIRDLAKQMNSGALQRGAKDQKRMLELFEAVSDTLNRSRPAGLNEPPATDSFAEAAEMRLLMLRMDEAEKRMRTEAGTEGAMSSRRSMIVHEASMMASIAKIVTLQGYGYEDDPVFKDYAGEIIGAAQSIKIAAESSDFASYEGSLSKISTTCQNCHSKYKND